MQLEAPSKVPKMPPCKEFWGIEVPRRGCRHSLAQGDVVTAGAAGAGCVSGHGQCQLLWCHFSALCWQPPVVLMVTRGQDALISQTVLGRQCQGLCALCLSFPGSLWGRAVSPPGTDVAFTHSEKRQ